MPGGRRRPASYGLLNFCFRHQTFMRSRMIRYARLTGGGGGDGRSGWHGEKLASKLPVVPATENRDGAAGRPGGGLASSVARGKRSARREGRQQGRKETQREREVDPDPNPRDEKTWLVDQSAEGRKFRHEDRCSLCSLCIFDTSPRAPSAAARRATTYFAGSFSLFASQPLSTGVRLWTERLRGKPARPIPEFRTTAKLIFGSHAGRSTWR